MNKALYPKLALQNIIKNGKFYFPYILTIICSCAAFYIILALNGSPDLPDSSKYVYLSAFVSIGAVVIALFSVIFLFYTNSFLMKRRNKELGLYNILGMGKQHIAKVLMYETLYTGIVGIGFGIVLGILLQKLVTLLLYKIMHFELYYKFYIFKSGIVITCALFCGILFLNLLYNLGRIRLQKPIELLHSDASGEREPKTKWFLTIAGILTLGAGYYIAIATSNAIDALSMYFVAVILVIIGTYCLFTAVSISVLKLLKKNKTYYYRTNHFISVSGMLYRMKRNAVGLANICILSTIVLVMVSGTLSLFLGTEDALKTRYPADICAEVKYDPTESETFRPDEMNSRLTGGIEQCGLEIKSSNSFSYLEFAAGLENGVFSTFVSNIPLHTLLFITADDYARLTDTVVPELGKNEIMCYSNNSFAGDIKIDFKSQDGHLISQRTFTNIKQLDSFPSISDYSVYMINVEYIVVPDTDTITDIYIQQLSAYNSSNTSSSFMNWYGQYDISGSDDEKISCAEYLASPDNIGASYVGSTGSWESYEVESRAENTEDFYTLNGGFFFLGIFLGLLFIMATVLIIYYKQISEGYEDAERYKIMQKVGLSRREIKRSINGQILTVFFMPLIVAAIHVAFDFKLMTKLLTLFGLVNQTVTLLCTAGTLCAFILIYGIVYTLTAKAYYKIVS